MNSPKISIAIVGWGVVSQAFYKHLMAISTQLFEERNIDLDIQVIVARSGLKGKTVSDNTKILQSVNDLLDYAQAKPIDIVIELIGGTDDAYQLAKFCAHHKIHLITANKALVAKFGEELFPLFGRQTMLRFEAAVAGGIPILRTLRDSFMDDKIVSMMGILNGTTNFILTQMENGATQQDAIRLAQEKGYAEADPSLDIDGSDPMHKSCILARLAFAAELDVSLPSFEGLPNNLSSVDFAFAKDNHMSIKSTAIMTRFNSEKDVEIRVHLSLLENMHPLANVNNEYNGILLQCEFSANTNYIGPGAGGAPTASAVIADLIEVCVAANHHSDQSNEILLRQPAAKLCGINQTRKSARYLRVELLDEPGVFSQICTVLGENDININSVLQVKGVTDNSKTAQFLLDNTTEISINHVIEHLNANQKVIAAPLQIRIIA